MFLTNSPNAIINRSDSNKLNKSFKSDYTAFTVTLELETETKRECKQNKYAFNKVNWKDLNRYIEEHPFKPYCYSSVDELVKQWYKWLKQILDENVHK